MKSIFAIALLTVAGHASAALAIWNGQLEYVTTVSGATGVRCGYNSPYGTVTQVFVGAICPTTIEVQ